MTKRTVLKKKSPRTSPRRAREKQPKKATNVSGTAPDEVTFTHRGSEYDVVARRKGAEPTFPLSQITRLFGGNYGGNFDPVLTMALNAMDDVRRTVRVCIEALPHQGDDSPIDPVRELLEQVWERSEATCGILNAIRVPVPGPAKVAEGGAS
jgi:hypothetical protein